MQTSLDYKKASRYFYILLLAGIYNLIWGAWVIFFPNLSFALHGMKLPLYPEIWQCVGMIVGVYGIGYIAAASDPIKHWPIVLVGFLGKIFGPIGFMQALYNEVFPLSFMINIVFNDLIWWVPFFIILKESYQFHTKKAPAKSIDSIGLKPKSLIVALRHQGCTFSRENLDELSKNISNLKQKGFAIYILHMSQNDEINPLIKSYIKEDIALLSDPKQEIYQALNLQRATLLKAFGISEFLKGAKAFLKGHGLGPLRGDGFQLGGLFVIENNKLIKSYPAQRASDIYNYEQILLL